MKTQMIVMALIVMVSLVGANTIIAGNSFSFESEQFEYWDVVGNASSMEGMDVNWDNGNTTISFAVGYAADTFTLVLFNNETKVITEHHYSGGGGGGGTRTIYRDRNVTSPVEFVYRDIVTEVPGETITETISEDKTSLWVPLLLILLIVIVCVIVYQVVSSSRNQEEINGSEMPKV